MKSKTFILVISFITLHTVGKAQSFDCNSFCVQDIRFDTVDPDILIATIYFSAENNSFINYPYVSAIVDHLGDTIATGTLNFFGQIGNTSQDYPLTPRIKTLPDNLEAFLFFHYDTISCVLSFPCLVSSTMEYSEFAALKIYPNPFTTGLMVEPLIAFKDASMNMYNSVGQLVWKEEHLSGSKIELRRGNLKAGIYYLQVIDGHHLTGITKVLVLE